MLSTPATRLERRYLLSQRQTPLLSPITSSQQQGGGAPPQHTHMCVATCKPRISFQRKFTTSVKIFFSSFPVNIRTTSLPWPGSSSGSPRVDPNLPFRVQGLKRTYNLADILFFFPTHLGSRKSVFSSIPPAFSYHSLHFILVSLYSFNNAPYTHEPTALQHSSWFS